MNSGQIIDEIGGSYRQLDVWTKSKFLGDDPKNTGIGSSRMYSAAEVEIYARMLGLVKAGVRPAIASIIAKGDGDLIRSLQSALERCKK